MKKTLLIAILAFSTAAFAQAQEDPTGVKLVTVSSKGKDVRGVLYDLFEQAEQSFILDPKIDFTLYLSLRDVGFEEALGAILNIAALESELQNGIYFIKPRPVEAGPLPKPPVGSGTGKPALPVGRLTDEDLKAVKVTTKFEKTDLRVVFAEFEKQTGIRLEVTNNVPDYKIDAFINNKNLLDTLLMITKATGLTFRKSEFRSIIVDRKEE